MSCPCGSLVGSLRAWFGVEGADEAVAAAAAAKKSCVRKTTVTLLEHESISSFLHLIPPIGTITFFKGSHARQVQKIKERVSKVVAANPWLAGSLHMNSAKKRVELSYPAAEDVDLDRVFLSMQRGDLEVYADMTPQELYAICDGCPAVVKKSSECLDSDEALFRVTVVPDFRDPSGGFALIVAFSHVLGDGFTYYSIFNMLSEDSPVRSLSVTRRDTWEAEYGSLVGETAKGFPRTAPLIMNVLRSALFGRQKKFVYHVDNRVIELAKARAKGKHQVPFLSTNDILTAALVKMMNAGLLLTPVNMRGRVPCLLDTDAGNYVSAVPWTAEKATEPALLRQGLIGSMSGYSFENPGFLKVLTSRLVVVTNWSTFAKGLVFEGCQQHFHSPVFNLQGNTGVIFKSKPDQLSILVCSEDQSVGPQSLDAILREAWA